MIRLTGYDQNMEVLVHEEERILSSKGFIDKDEMYKIMMHLAEKLADYENLEEQGKLLVLTDEVKQELAEQYRRASELIMKLPLEGSQEWRGYTAGVMQTLGFLFESLEEKEKEGISNE